jgi:hypothetical protein
MKKTTILTVLAAIAILGFANTTFADGRRDGGGYRHQESRHEFRGDYHRDFHRDYYRGYYGYGGYRSDYVIVRPYRPVYVCPPRSSGIIISPFLVIRF